MRTKLHRLLLILLVGLFSIGIRATESISIPLKMSVFSYMPMDKPTGSTPDPTDPNQFRASLSGNTLFIQTQKDAVSYVVIQETQAESNNEDYFYDSCYHLLTAYRYLYNDQLLADLNSQLIKEGLPGLYE